MWERTASPDIQGKLPKPSMAAVTTAAWSCKNGNRTQKMSHSPFSVGPVVHEMISVLDRFSHQKHAQKNTNEYITPA